MKRYRLGTLRDRIFLFCQLAIRHFKCVSVTDIEFYKDPWYLILSLVLSIRSRDSVVNDFVRDNYSSLEIGKIKDFSVNDLCVLFKPFGLKSKSSTVKSLAEIYPIISENWSKIIEIKGVGRKILDVFSNVYLDEMTVGVDTHTLQMFNKIGKLKWSVSKVRKFLNEQLETSMEKKLCHIILVRFNKNGNWCGDKECRFCRELLRFFLNMNGV